MAAEDELLMDNGWSLNQGRVSDPGAPDPYAPIRRLPIRYVSPEDAAASVSLVERGEGAGTWEPTLAEGYSFDFESLKPHGYQSKYNQITPLDDGRLLVRLQQPGAHKYDTMDAIYAKNADGEWELQNDPMQARTRTGDNGILRDPRKDVRNLGMDLGLSERVATGLSQGPTGSAALMVTDLARGVNQLGGDGNGYVGRLNREVMRNAKADTRTEERGASRAALIAGAAYGSTYLGAGAGTTAGAGATGADMGAIVAGSADGGALAASGSGVAGGTAATATATPTITTTMGGTTAAQTAGGGIMSGMTVGDWLGVATTAYGLANQPEAPDTSGLNQAARDSAQMSRDAFDWFKAEYERTAPTREAAAVRDGKIADAQLAGMEFATAEAKDLAERNRTVFRPVEDRIVGEAMNFDTPARRAQAVAEATADVEGAAGRAQQANQRAIMRTGATMSGPAAQALSQDAAMLKAKMVAGATGAATRNVEQQGWARLNDAAALGKGVVGNQGTQQQIATNSGSAAVSAGAGAINATQAGVPIMQSGFNTSGQALQTAGQLFGQAGSLTSATRGQDLSFLGNAFGAYMRSSEDVKTGTGKVTDGEKEKAEIMATPVEEDWQYDPAKGGPDDGGKKHTGPMAGKVRAKMGESAAPGGEVIDMRVMGGKMMAAIQAVVRDVEQLRDEIAGRAKMGKKPATAQEG